MSKQWSQWQRFPDPRKLELQAAPFGPGCYELRNGAQLILYGMGNHVAQRMTSLLPAPFGCGTRNNHEKRKYVLENLASIEYRTLACATREAAKKHECQLKADRTAYRFPT